MSKHVAQVKLTRGYTLIEILVVVLLIGLIATSATVLVNTSTPQKELDQVIEKFTGISYQMGDISILTGEPMGLVLTPPLWSTPTDTADERKWSYTWRRFVELTDAEGNILFEWMAVEGIDLIELDPRIELFVQIEGSDWEWEESTPSEVPLFVIYPTGEAEPFSFEMEFRHRDLSVEPQHVTFNTSGRLEWTEAVVALEEIKESLR